MKPRIAIPLGVAGILAAIGTSIANANGLFAGHPSLAYWFWAASLAMIVIAVAGWLFGSDTSSFHSSEPATKSPLPPPLPPPVTVHQENKQEFNPQFNPTFNPQQNLYVGSMSPAREAQQNQDEKSMLEYIQTKHPLRLYEIDKVAEERGITMPAAKTIMERMATKGILNKYRVNEMMGSVGYMLDEVYRLPDKKN